MSEWLHGVLSPHVEEIVVLGVPPGKKGPKSDARDAAGLANQLRLGDMELAVWKGHGAFRQLRDSSLQRAEGELREVEASGGAEHAGGDGDEQLLDLEVGWRGQLDEEQGRLAP